MTRKEDPGLWWHRKLQWMMAAIFTVGLSVVGYIAVKWDKSADAVITMGANISDMKENIQDIRDGGKETQQDMEAVRNDVSALKTTTDARLKELEKSEWWRDLIGDTDKEKEKDKE